MSKFIEVTYSWERKTITCSVNVEHIWKVEKAVNDDHAIITTIRQGEYINAFQSYDDVMGMINKQ